MKISVNIPSYKRPKVKSLDYLSFCNVWVCETEHEEYKKANTKGNVIAVPKGVQGNVCRIRNYILDDQFKAGFDAVCIIDDDFDGIYHFRRNGNYGYEKELVGEDIFLDWLESNTIVCDEFGFKLWGVNVNADPKAYRQFTPINTNGVVLGPFCVHLPNPIRYDEALPLKEDYDMALQHMKANGGVLRFNGYHYMCDQSNIVGGCANYRNYKREREQFELLQKKWGTKIVRADSGSVKSFDYNPIVRVPIKGV